MKKFVWLFFNTAFLLLAQPAPPYWLVGNYAPAEVKAQTPALIPWDKYTHVNDFAISPTPQCGIDASLLRSQMESFVEEAHAHRKQALVTLKDGAPGILFSCSGPSQLAAFVTAVVRFVNAHHYDGIDLDWEEVPRWFASSYISRYEDLISQLRTSLPGKVLTMSVYPNAEAHALEQVATTSQSKLDRVSVMCYDMDGVGSGNATTWYVDALWTGEGESEPACEAAVHAFTARGLANRKINIGFPFYARLYPGVTQAGVVRPTANRTTLFYRDLVRDPHLWQSRYQRFDRQHGANYLSIPDPTHPGTQRFVPYGGPEMIDAVAEWVKTKGFGGVMTYTTGYEYLPEEVGDRRYPLTTRMYHQLFCESDRHGSVAGSRSKP